MTNQLRTSQERSVRSTRKTGSFLFRSLPLPQMPEDLNSVPQGVRYLMGLFETLWEMALNILQGVPLWQQKTALPLRHVGPGYALQTRGLHDGHFI